MYINSIEQNKYLGYSYNFISNLEEGKAKVKKNASEGYIDTNADVIPTEEICIEPNVHKVQKLGLWYIVDDNKIYIVEYFGNKNVLTIPAEIDGKPVVGLGYRYYYQDINYNYSPVKVILPSTIETIAPGFFDTCCCNVTRVDGLEYVKYCYGGLQEIEEAVFSDNLEILGGVLYDQKKLVIPDDVTILPGFYSLLMLKEIETVPGKGEKTVKAIDNVLFSADEKTLICYPCSKDAFSYTIPNTVTKILNYAFFACGFKLNELVIPASVTDLNSGCFAGGSKPCDYVVSEGSVAYEVIDEMRKANPTLVQLVSNGEGGVTSVVEEIVNNCCNDSNTDYENALALHDWLIDNVEYDFTYQYVYASQMLKYHTGVCAAYADTYHFLLKEAGIENEVVGNFEHAWVAAKLDGYWTYIDPTWDDVGGSDMENHRYFGFNNSIRYTVYGASYPDLINQRVAYMDDIDAYNTDLHYWKQEGYVDNVIDLYYQDIVSHITNGQYNFSIVLKPEQTLNDYIASSVIAGSLSMKQYHINKADYHVTCDYENGQYYVYATTETFVGNELFDTTIKNGAIQIEKYRGDATNVIVPSEINGLPVRYLNRTFYGMDMLESVTLPEGLLEIGGNTFLACYSLKHINFPMSLKRIDDMAFCYCNNLESDIILPEGLTYIGALAFGFNFKIKKAYIPSTLTIFRDMAFMDCYSLSTVKLAEGLELIGVACFSNCYSLKAITLPESLKYLGSNAFGNSGLERIRIPANVSFIGRNAFATLDLKQIAVDQNNANYMIVDHCLVDNNGVVSYIQKSSIGEDYYFPYGISTIGFRTFQYNDELKAVHIPTSVTHIENESFYFCDNLTDIYYDGTMAEWGQITFDSGWCNYRQKPVIHCTDGDINL